MGGEGRWFGLLLLAQVLVGAAAIFARFALTGADALAVSALRLALAGGPLLAWALARRRLKRLDRSLEAGFAAAGALLALHFVTWIASLGAIPVAISTLLVCTAPVWNTLYDRVAEGRRPGARFWGASLLALAGLGLVCSGPSRGTANPAWIRGCALATAGGMAMAAYLVLVQKLDRRAGGVPTLGIVARTYAWAALGLVGAAALAGSPPPALGDRPAWMGILGMALVSQMGGHSLLNAAVRRIPAVTVAFTTLLEPVCAGLLAALVFGERLGPAMVAGGALILAGVVLCLWPGRRVAC
ncbi:MAG TPA: DMT family transporter [Holophaga sp.]|nr:DMT family transporter [Holophaga sp.]